MRLSGLPSTAVTAWTKVASAVKTSLCCSGSPHGCVRSSSPSHSSRLKITLKLPTQTQKPACVHRIIHKDKVIDGIHRSQLTSCVINQRTGPSGCEVLFMQ